MPRSETRPRSSSRGRSRTAWRTSGRSRCCGGSPADRSDRRTTTRPTSPPAAWARSSRLPSGSSDAGSRRLLELRRPERPRHGADLHDLRGAARQESLRVLEARPLRGRPHRTALPGVLLLLPLPSAMTRERGFAFRPGELDALRAALSRLERGFADLPAVPDEDEIGNAAGTALLEAAGRMTDNYPYFHPLYAGQMLKPPHPVARLAYALSLWINPNNHALDGGRASSVMEKEAVAELAHMFRWDAHLGHLCGGGTMANLEALWVAGKLAPGKTVVASTQAHYTHGRISAVLN